MSKKGVVGSKGTTTPMAPIANDTLPATISTHRLTRNFFPDFKGVDRSISFMTDKSCGLSLAVFFRADAEVSFM